jgi:hydrogenase 3 maturation protease
LSEQLNQELTNHLAKNKHIPRLVILGIGNEMNGDDAAGVLVVRKLKKLLPKNDQLFLIEASIAPENYTSLIKKLKPDWIWIIDAADVGIEPGGFQLVEISTIDEIGANTHRISLSLLISYLHSELKTEISVFGIQPVSIDPFTDLSRPVKNTIQQISKILLLWLKNTYNN